MRIFSVCLLFICGTCISQSVPISIAAGFTKGWHDEVTYHPNQLFNQFPNLNRNFWDIRVQNEPEFLNTEWDADHVLKSAHAGLFVIGLALKVGEKKKWYKYVFDGVKYMLSYKLGFYISYNLINKNKL